MPRGERGNGPAVKAARCARPVPAPRVGAGRSSPRNESCGGTASMEPPQIADRNRSRPAPKRGGLRACARIYHSGYGKFAMVSLVTTSSAVQVTSSHFSPLSSFVMLANASCVIWEKLWPMHSACVPSLTWS